MVHIGKVYTKTGDKGTTSLVDGTRVAKDDARLEAYGDVDELNATLGVVACAVSDVAVAGWVRAIQNDLFDLGADLATPTSDDGEDPEYALRVVDAQVERLENEIDSMNEDLPDLTSFVLPGGCIASAELHRARTICRRAERRAVALGAEASINDSAIRYLNRLSDWLFVASRRECLAAGDEVFWVPAANR